MDDEGDMPVIKDPSGEFSPGSATVSASFISAGPPGTESTLWSVAFGARCESVWIEEVLDDIGEEQSPVLSRVLSIPLGATPTDWRITAENDLGNQAVASGSFTPEAVDKADAAVCVGKSKTGSGVVSLDPIMSGEPSGLGVIMTEEISSTDVPIKLVDEL
jgi:hypothetical protein